jgi:hypothetical protein
MNLTLDYNLGLHGLTTTYLPAKRPVSLGDCGALVVRT